MAHIPLPTPNRLEELALFRHAIIGDLVVSDLPRGTLQDELKHRAKRRYRPPGASASRTYHWKTLQRWLLAAREGRDDPKTPLRRLRCAPCSWLPPCFFEHSRLQFVPSPGFGLSA